MPPPKVSVLLPINNALPYLAVAVRDVVKQDLGGGDGLEVVCSWDGGPVADWEWLAALVALVPRGRIVVVEDAEAGTSPAAEERTNELFGGGGEESFPSVAEVAAACRPEHEIVAARYADGANRGQGAAMSLALRVSRGEIIAHMEADDARPRDDALRTMVAALSNADGCCTESYCFGGGLVSRNMIEYVEWQNGLRTWSEMAAARFVEIPALHQTSAFWRSAVDRVGGYRDGPRSGDHGADLDTPVDLWWWLSFFEAGFRCVRVVGSSAPHDQGLARPPDNAFFGWRQHDRQRTRAHGRLSIENIRRIKLHFLLRAFPDHPRVVVISVGATLAAWADDLRKSTTSPPRAVDAVEWRPSRDSRRPNLPAAARRSTTDPPVLRLWAYGSARVRERLRGMIPDWHPTHDIYVA